jgi:flagellar biosynthesis protein FlhA
VITKGATRISEVAARFALDAMPGRQSAIDADLNAGNLDPQQAAEQRNQLGAEADFYAAMDGAGKFVRGDAVAGLVITAINLIGGLYLGLAVHGMPLGDATEMFSKLTIGDGLVSQLPSLLISLAAGILVTRGTRRIDLSDHVVKQLLGNAHALAVAGGFLLVLVLTGLPKLPLLMLGSGCLLIAATVRRHEQHQAEQREAEREQEATASAQKRVEDFLAVDPLEVAIGLGLLPLADPSRGGDLMQRIASLRNQMAAEIGIVLPKVRVRDDATLGQHEYEIRLFGDLVARGQLRTDKLLATSEGRTTGTVPGEVAGHLSGPGQAVWIAPSERESALIYGYKTRTSPSVLADHLEQVARAHGDELLSHDATKHLLDELRQVAPALVEEWVPARLAIADVQKVLQGLLRESIPIRQLGIILEALGDASRHTMDPEEQIECVRRRLARTLCAPLRDERRVLRVATLDAELAAALEQNRVVAATLGAGQGGDHKTQDFTCDALRQAVKNLTDDGFPPVVLVEASLRRRVKQIADRAEIWTHVLSTQEISPETRVSVHCVAGAHVPSAAA